jgi:hypothetical protein
MTHRYYRYTIEAAVRMQDVGRSLGDMGATIVRIDNRAGTTEVTVALPENREPDTRLPLGAGIEVSEEDVLNLGDQ